MGAIVVETWSTTCLTCGTPIVMTEAMHQQRLRDGQSYYCPNGHGQHFTDSLEGQLAEERRRREREHERAERLLGIRESLERSIQAYRMNLGKARKRIQRLEARLTELDAIASQQRCETEVVRAP